MNHKHTHLRASHMQIGEVQRCIKNQLPVTVFMEGNLVSWKSKKHNVVFGSSANNVSNYGIIYKRNNMDISTFD